MSEEGRRLLDLRMPFYPRSTDSKLPSDGHREGSERGRHRGIGSWVRGRPRPGGGKGGSSIRTGSDVTRGPGVVRQSVCRRNEWPEGSEGNW